MIYSYECITLKGQQTDGFLPAKSASEARSVLAAHGLSVRHLALHPLYTLYSVIFRGYRGIQEKHLEDFSASFRDLVGAGVPLSEVLDIVRASLPNPVTRSAMDRVKILVEDQGLSISDAMLRSGFPEFYTSQLAVGFDAGAAEQTLTRLIGFYKWKYKSAWEMKKLLFYPAFLISFVFLFVVCIIFFVMPKLSDLFEGNPNLPFLTKVFYSLGNGELRHNPGQLMLVITGITVTGFISWKIIRYMFHLLFVKSSPTSYLGKNPLVRFYQMTVLNTYISALATSIEEGFSLSVALQRAAKVFVHRDGFYRQLADSAVRQSEQGEQLLPILRPFLTDDSLAVHLRVAESSGNTVDALERISRTLRNRVERYIEPAANVLKFGSIIIVAIVVIACLFAVYFPMYQQMINAFD